VDGVAVASAAAAVAAVVLVEASVEEEGLAAAVQVAVGNQQANSVSSEVTVKGIDKISVTILESKWSKE
jgi:hypothetical protein